MPPEISTRIPLEIITFFSEMFLGISWIKTFERYFEIFLQRFPQKIFLGLLLNCFKYSPRKLSMDLRNSAMNSFRNSSEDSFGKSEISPSISLQNASEIYTIIPQEIPPHFFFEESSSKSFLDSFPNCSMISFKKISRNSFIRSSTGSFQNSCIGFFRNSSMHCLINFFREFFIDLTKNFFRFFFPKILKYLF